MERTGGGSDIPRSSERFRKIIITMLSSIICLLLLFGNLTAVIYHRTTTGNDKEQQQNEIINISQNEQQYHGIESEYVSKNYSTLLGKFVLRNSTSPEWILFPRYIVKHPQSINTTCISRALWNGVLTRKHIRLSLCRGETTTTTAKFADLRIFHLITDRETGFSYLKATIQGLHLSSDQMASLLGQKRKHFL